MYLTKQQLQRIIQEEIERLSEQGYAAQGKAGARPGPVGSTETYQQMDTAPSGHTKGLEVTRVHGKGFEGSGPADVTGKTTDVQSSTGAETTTAQGKTEPAGSGAKLMAGEQDVTTQRTVSEYDPTGKETSAKTTTDTRKGLPAAGLNPTTLPPKGQKALGSSYSMVGESILHQIIQEELKAVLTRKI